MDRLLEYAGRHPWLATLALVTAVAVLIYELLWQAQNRASLAPQEAIRLMNQGATVLDLRPQEAYEAGHINGARHFDPEQIAKASDCAQALQGAAADRLLRSRYTRGRGGAPAVAPGLHQGIQPARRAGGLARREPAAGARVSAVAHAMAPTVLMYTQVLVPVLRAGARAVHAQGREHSRRSTSRSSPSGARR